VVIQLGFLVSFTLLSAWGVFGAWVFLANAKPYAVPIMSIKARAAVAAKCKLKYVVLFAYFIDRLFRNDWSSKA